MVSKMPLSRTYTNDSKVCRFKYFKIILYIFFKRTVGLIAAGSNFFYVLPSIARVKRRKVPCFLETFKHFLEFVFCRDWHFCWLQMPPEFSSRVVYDKAPHRVRPVSLVCGAHCRYPHSALIMEVLG